MSEPRCKVCKGPARRRMVNGKRRPVCPLGCEVSDAQVVREQQSKRGVTPIPPCAASMGCLCAYHAKGADASEPCDTDEHRRPGEAPRPGVDHDRLVAAFVRRMRMALTADELIEIDRKNAQDPGGPTCASHDVCDANMVMEAAFREVFRRGSRSNDADTGKINRAWYAAKAQGFAEHPEAEYTVTMIVSVPFTMTEIVRATNATDAQAKAVAAACERSVINWDGESVPIESTDIEVESTELEEPDPMKTWSKAFGPKVGEGRRP